MVRAEPKTLWDHEAQVLAGIAGSRSGGHVQENAAAAELDLAAELDEIEQLIALGPAFA